MEQQKIDNFLAMHRDEISPANISDLRKRLETMDESKANMLAADFKNPTTVLIISILLGTLGIDRFMLGNVGMGVLKLLTGGVCGILWIIDIINYKKMTQAYNYSRFIQM